MWEQIGAIASVGCFIFAGLAFLFQIKPLPWKNKKLQESSIQTRYSKVMAALIIIGFLASGLTLWAAWNPIDRLHFPKDARDKLTWTEDRTFRKERVVIDNHGYRRCQMFDVTLVWNGTGPSAFVDTNIHGFDISTSSDSVQATVELLKGTHMLKEDIPVYENSGTKDEKLLEYNNR